MIRTLRRWRIPRNRIWSWLERRNQKTPSNMPVVFKRGWLILDPYGKKIIEDWYLDCTHMKEPVDIDDLWDYLLAKFPESLAMRG